MTHGRVALAALLLASAACRRDRGEPPSAAEVDAVATATRPPIDRLGPLELAEGSEDAFGLRLPRELRVTRRFPAAVHARSSTVTAAALSAYVRARVGEGTVLERDGMTRFENVRASRAPARLLRVEVRPTDVDSSDRVELLVQDVTPPPPPVGDPAERMRSIGLTPDGKLADPDHLQ